jgi:hypothetical protein
MNFIQNIDFSRFKDALPYMGVGMIGVFLIIGIIIGATYLINYSFNKIGNK